MKKYLLMLLVVTGFASAITLEDIIRLSQAQIGDEIILRVIQVSEEIPALTTEDILRLKKENVSDKVVVALIQLAREGKMKTIPGAEKEPQDEESQMQEQGDGRELSPFDQFFLSTYYSHDYGWPEKNYESPADILSQGLYYQPPSHYPNSRKYRVYGHGYSVVPGVPNSYSFSPYSILVRKRQKGGHYHHNGQSFSSGLRKEKNCRD